MVASPRPLPGDRPGINHAVGRRIATPFFRQTSVAASIVLFIVVVYCLRDELQGVTTSGQAAFSGRKFSNSDPPEIDRSALLSFVGSNSNSSKSDALSIAPGELPGYTGWARPSTTLAGYVSIVGGETVGKPLEDTLVVGQTFFVTLACRSNPSCWKQSSSGSPLQFYARAYGPAIATGIVNVIIQSDTTVLYQLQIKPMVPGDYTVELVLTYSNPPKIRDFPLDSTEANAKLCYEGYLVAGFPLFLRVLPGAHAKSLIPVDLRDNHQLPICTKTHLVETSPTSALDAAQWVLVDQMRCRLHHSSSEHPGHVELENYARGFNNLGIRLDYRYQNCQVVDLEQPASLNLPTKALLSRSIRGCLECLQNNLFHIVLIGDSTMRLQRDIIQPLVNDLAKSRTRNVHVSFFELYGGLLRCQRQSSSGPDLLKIASGELIDRVPRESNVRRIVIFNSGLHDIHRLCGSEWADDRKTYLTKEELDTKVSCVDLYRQALQTVLLEAVTTIPADARIYQTTTAGWPKYGNYGVAWNPTQLQRLPLDTSFFVKEFNQIAWDLIQRHNQQEQEEAGMNKKKKKVIEVVDGYWISLSRPDSREVDENASIGKKLSHPGLDVMEAMVRIWMTIVLETWCGSVVFDKDN